MASDLRPKSGFVLVFLLDADKLTYSQAIGWASPILIYFSEVLAKGFILKKKNNKKTRGRTSMLSQSSL